MAQDGARLQRLTRATLAARVPVVAAIDGVCIGGALEFAASCDMRTCTERARFGTPEVRIGLGATNAGTLVLPELLGETAARELLLTGGLFDAEWTRAHGFVSEVVPDAAFDSHVSELARTFDATSRDAVAATKRILKSGWAGWWRTRFAAKRMRARSSSRDATRARR